MLSTASISRRFCRSVAATDGDSERERADAKRGEQRRFAHGARRKTE